MTADRRFGRGALTWPAVASIAVATTSCFLVYRLVAAYGWEGSYWLIWEGSPYHPKIRDRSETLDMEQEKIDEKERAIAALEDGLDIARRDGPSGEAAAAVDSSEIVRRWQTYLLISDVRTHLAQLSDDLDKVAARIDGIPSSGEVEIKERKKALSQTLVQLMERMDALIIFYSSSC